MYLAVGWKTLIVFGAFNFVSLPLIYFFPETSGRSLEEVNLLFSSSSPFVSANEKEYKGMLEEAGGNVAVADRRMMEKVDEPRSGGKESVSSEDEY